jgi:hypothetical protein
MHLIEEYERLATRISLGLCLLGIGALLMMCVA